MSHFYGSKQRLLVVSVELPFDPREVLPDLLGGDPQQVGERLARFIVSVLESDEGRRRVLGLVRAAATEPEAARLVRELLTEQVIGTVVEHLGADQPERRASFVGAQVVGLAMARHVVALEPLASLAPEDVVAALAPVLQHLLVDPLDAPLDRSA